LRLGLGAVTFFVLVAIAARQFEQYSAWCTGYSLLLLIFALGAFGVRKKLSMLPLRRAATWTRLHVTGGALAVALFWLHTGSLWPSGTYEQVMAFLFYAVSLSGVVGYVIDRTYPHRLTQTGTEVIFERIPAELVNLREQAEAVILECTQETRSETLARHYLETLSWFFRKPRFVLSHIWGARKGTHWLQNQRELVNRYLNDAERSYLERLQMVADAKDKLDFHYAVQGLMKHWLFVHVPLVAAMFIFVLWHLLLVNIYV
jgi:hypothetical protein